MQLSEDKNRFSGNFLATGLSIAFFSEGELNGK